MEAIFGKMSEAYEVLSNAKRREQYDAEMGIEHRVQPAPPSPPPSPGPTPPPTISGEFRAFGQRSLPHSYEPPAKGPSGASSPTSEGRIPVVSAPPTSAPHVSSEELERIRRQNLARRLTGIPRALSQPRMEAVTASTLTSVSAVESIKNRYLEKGLSDRPGGRISDIVARAESLANQGD